MKMCFGNNDRLSEKKILTRKRVNVIVIGSIKFCTVSFTVGSLQMCVSTPSILPFLIQHHTSSSLESSMTNSLTAWEESRSI
jgi:hypothetical protein